MVESATLGIVLIFIFVIIGIAIFFCCRGTSLFAPLTVPPAIISPGNIPNTIRQNNTNNCISTNRNIIDNQQYPLTIQTCGDGNFNQIFTHQSNNTFTTSLGGETLCMDVQGPSNNPGTQVGIFACNGGSNQAFTVNSDGTIGVTIDSVTRCLNNNNGNLQIAVCNASDSNQQWIVNS